MVRLRKNKMSFSQEIKKELMDNIATARHCQIAELAALLCLCGKMVVDKSGRIHIKLQTENCYVAKKFFLLVKKVLSIKTEIIVRAGQAGGKHLQYHLFLRREDAVKRVLEATKLQPVCNGQETVLFTNPLVIQNTCCKRAYLRGAFLCIGSVTNPEKAYHFELVAQDVKKAELLRSCIAAFDIDAKCIERKGYQVVYVKEGSQVVDLLNVMEAHVALMNFENVRIVKDVRNDVNRKVNCEAANINKTVQAARKQIEDILLIQSRAGLEQLPEGLEEIARLRMEYPEASLKELGEMLTPPMGKSGVNHRLKKIGEYAERFRE